MTQRSYNRLTVTIFAVIGILHLWRVVSNVPAAIDGWWVPMWLSWLAIIVTGIFVYQGSRLLK